MRRHVVIIAAALAWLISLDKAEARLDILVDKSTQRMLVIQNGFIRYMWPVSTGRDDLATPSGVYAPQRMERNWFSSSYYNSPMPYAIFFHNGYAIHGSYAIDRLGGPASHGCVRLHPQHAARLFDLVLQEGPEHTTIEVTDAPRPDDPAPRAEPAAGQGPFPPEPRMVRYREPPEGEPPPQPRGNRTMAARTPPAPRPATPERRLSTSLLAQNAPPEPAQPAQPSSTLYGFKVLPASCWSGGASRWRWWASSQTASCK
ncbi:L,D-transpeptidase [Bradyrhizobium sp. STM 3809]|uniref:L,D-transpeptidase n=1 Tax=Bradyrhizobium sp. STM 3809 TaxID=551936 RepID=UPI0002405B11|nr:L,D-transpeptidase [Bradyrhizobium sp. STM 3809]CCD99654.1 conserved hypothetical protein [Bradyrhizobium sp. STM 3809]